MAEENKILHAVSPHSNQDVIISTQRYENEINQELKKENCDDCLLNLDIPSPKHVSPEQEEPTPNAKTHMELEEPEHQELIEQSEIKMETSLEPTHNEIKPNENTKEEKTLVEEQNSQSEEIKDDLEDERKMEVFEEEKIESIVANENEKIEKKNCFHEKEEVII